MAARNLDALRKQYASNAADPKRPMMMPRGGRGPGGPGGPYCELPPEAPPADTTPSEPTETSP